MTDRTTTELAVSARKVAFAYGEREALRGVDFEVPRGSVHGFLGPNGSGKSTLFKILATILPLTRGEVSILGLDLRSEAAALRRKIGVVFQSPALDKKLSIRRNLTYGGKMFGLSGADLTRRVDQMLDYANLADRANDNVGELSGGLRRRVELAKGMLHEPELLLLDEPSTGLDPGARDDLWEFLSRREGLTVLFTTHLMDEAERASHLTILHQGEVVGEGSPAELRASVGGEVLELGCAEPQRVADELRREHGVDATVLEGVVRVESQDAHALAPVLMKTHAAEVDTITLRRPSLEDVFLGRTGRRLTEDS
ncbi:MAG: ABC transporter ATP-binding protein [Planctomycetes bacterium]|nr:ABC transporter ATP-binding protein [Planctomycetota bacterium]